MNGHQSIKYVDINTLKISFVELRALLNTAAFTAQRENMPNTAQRLFNDAELVDKLFSAGDEFLITKEEK